MTLNALADSLAKGTTTSTALVEDCLARIDDETGEGKRVFVSVAREAVRNAARAMDALRAAGAAPSRYAGIPVSIKDLFDIAGEVTRAGSVVLKDAPPATRDALAVARLKSAGFIVIGRTNMTEFAFSGVGINPHYGTPLSIYDRSTGRVPGGSTSGGAIAITDGMAHGSLGTDTGGSCRIPAAFNGIVGFKPTARRVPTQGAFPLSTSLDSVGSLGNSVSCCAILDSALAGKEPGPLHRRDPRGLRIAVPKTYVLDNMDAHVTAAFERSLRKLADAGAVVNKCSFPEIEAIPQANAKGGFAAPESLAVHAELIGKYGECYDPRVLSRVNRGQEQSAVDYIALVGTRARLIAEFNARMQQYDILVYPTVPIIPPPISAFVGDAEFARLNLLILRNPSVINFLDGCAISIPVSSPTEAPVGLTLAATQCSDQSLLSAAAGIELLFHREALVSGPGL